MFDFDGVLVDSLKIAYEGIRASSSNPPSLEEYKSYFNGNIYDKLEKIEGVKLTTSKNDQVFKLYTPKLLKLDPVKGMREVIEYFHNNEHIKIVIISSTINKPIEEWVNKNKLNSYFSKIYGADVHKSKIKKMRMALDEYDVKETDALFITDTLGDIREANKVGIPTIAVTWGFQHKDTLTKGSPRNIVDSPEELLKLVQNY